ncbi:MAG: HDOD domain-containing protein, partial [Candidatus Zixiibacteriota bacterium]
KQTRGEALIDAEREIFGIDHCELGHHLATSWRLPERICDAIAVHHSLSEADSHDKLANIIKLSVLLSFDRFSDCESNLEERLTNLSVTAKLLDLSQPQIDEVMKDLLTSTLRMASDLGVDIGSSDNLLSKANQEIWKSYLTIEHLFKERQELSERLLKEEREKGMAAAKNVALATLSHYLNNAVMAIYGRSQLMTLLKERNELDRLVEQVPRTAKIIKQSIYRITAVMQEMKEIKPSDQIEFYNQSEAMNIDDRIDRRMEKMSRDDNITVPLG